ncbi:MAG: dihydroorotase [Treponema sp.]|nr:dihydroorotase [Treponema sp.]
MKDYDSTLIIYNVRLVDSRIDSPGVIVVNGQTIKGIFLGEVTDSKTALKVASAVLVDSELEVKPTLYNGNGLTLMPSFVDMHAHFRYPGQTHKEDLDTGLQAAIAGGYGTVVLMPNTTPVVSSKKKALEIIEETKKRNLAKVFQTISITKDFKGEDTTEILSLNNSEFPVISEDGRDVGSSAVMLDAMNKAAKAGVIVSCHCEDVDLAQAAKPYRLRALSFMKKYNIPAGKICKDYQDVPDSVNFEIDGCLTAANQILALAEDVATERNIEIAKLAGCHIHICHCSTAASIDSVRRAKKCILEEKTKNGFECTVEVTPHHIGLVGTESPYIRALVNPPLRSEEDRFALINAIKDGTVDVIATDHAPHTQEDKDAGCPGFTGLETSFAICNTVLVNREGLSLSKLSALMSDNPARILKLNSGRLEVGFDANFVLVDPEEIWTVDSSSFLSKGKSTPVEGRSLIGRVKATFYDGNQVFALDK